MRAPLVLISILALACDRSEPAPAPTPSKAATDSSKEAPAPADACGPARATELETLLLDGCSDAPIQDARPLAVATWKPTHRGGLGMFAIEVTSKGAELRGQPLAAADVRREIERAREWAEADAPAFALAIQGDAKLGEVQEIVAALVDAEAKRGVLLFASGTLPKTPPAAHPELHAKQSAKIEALDPSQRAVSIARELETLVAPCPPIMTAFRKVATLDASQRCATLMKGVAMGVVECKCPAWTPELVSWLQVMSGPADAPRLHADDVVLDPSRGVSADPSATWASFVAQRSAPIDALWLGS